MRKLKNYGNEKYPNILVPDFLLELSSFFIKNASMITENSLYRHTGVCVYVCVCVCVCVRERERERERESE